MDKFKHKSKKTNLTNKIFNFPNQINTLTIFLLVIIYGLFLGIIINLIFPKYDYIVKLNYEPAVYNDEINPYIFVRGTATNVNKEENGEIELDVEYRVFAYINAMNSDNKPTKVRYAYSGLDKSGVMRYFYESTKHGSNLPVIHYVVSSGTYPGGDGYDKYFIKLRYDIKDSNQIVVTKELKFSEDVIDIKEKELSDERFTNNDNFNDLLKITFSFKDSTTNTYESNIKIEITDKNMPYQIDMQSWLVTKDNKIYPFLGLYNYSTKENFAPYYNTTVHKYLEPEFLYMKLYYTDESNVVNEMFYKISIVDLIAKTA